MAAGALLAALAIYVLFREGLWIHRLLASVAIPSGQLIGRAPDWLVYVLPDGLWQFAFCALVAQHTERPILLATPLAIGLGIELASAVHLVEGVFDPLDVLAMGLGGGLGYWVATREARARSDRTTAMVVAGFSVMLAATSKGPVSSSRGSGPSPPVAAPSPSTPPAASTFEVPAAAAGKLTEVPAMGVKLRLPAGCRLLTASAKPQPTGEPALDLALPSGYRARVDGRDLDLAEATDNARAHEKRGGVEVLLAAPDAIVAAYGGGCGAMACKQVGEHRLCGSIGAPASRPDGGQAEPLPTRRDCAAFVAALRSLQTL